MAVWFSRPKKTKGIPPPATDNQSIQDAATETHRPLTMTAVLLLQRPAIGWRWPGCSRSFGQAAGGGHVCSKGTRVASGHLIVRINWGLGNMPACVPIYVGTGRIDPR